MSSGDAAPLPAGLFGYVWLTTALQQLWLAALAILLFILTMGPLELQRRIVNSDLESRSMADVARLCAAYAALILGAGGIKMGFNLFRGWIGENAVRDLRRRVYDHAAQCEDCRNPRQEGVGMSVILSEAEPVGGFVGMSVSEPLMQIGTLVTVFTYMVVLQPWMAAFSLVLFSIQAFFVPRLQRAINRRAAGRIQVMRDLGGIVIDDFARSPALVDRHRFAQRVDRIVGLNMQIYWFKYLMNFAMNLTHHLGIIGVLLVGGWYVVQREIEVGTVVAFISGLKQVNDPWGDLVDYFREMTVSQVKYRLIAGILDRPAPHHAQPPGVAVGIPGALAGAAATGLSRMGSSGPCACWPW